MNHKKKVMSFFITNAIQWRFPINGRTAEIFEKKTVKKAKEQCPDKHLTASKFRMFAQALGLFDLFEDELTVKIPLIEIFSSNDIINLRNNYDTVIVRLKIKDGYISFIRKIEDVIVINEKLEFSLCTDSNEQHYIYDKCRREFEEILEDMHEYCNDEFIELRITFYKKEGKQ